MTDEQPQVEKPTEDQGSTRPPRPRWRVILASMLILAGVVLALYSALKSDGPETITIEIPPLDEVIADSSKLKPACDLLEQPLPPSLSEVDREAAEFIYRAIVNAAQNREDPESYGALGMVYDAHDMYPQAEAAYLEAHEMAPQAFKWAYYLALLAKDRNELETAAERLREAVELDPTYTVANLHLGEVELALGNLDAAEAAFRKYVERMPDDPLGHVGLGEVAQARNDVPGVIRHMEEALKYPPPMHSALYALGLAYQQQGDTVQAEAYLNRSRNVPKVKPLKDRLWAEKEALNRTPDMESRRFLAAMMRGNLGAAERIATGLTERYPEDAIHWVRLAEVKRMQRQFDESRSALKKALQLDPKSPDAHLAAARLEGDQGHIDKAKDHVDYVVATTPNSHDAWALRAAVYNELDDLSEAIRSARKAVEIQPASPQYRQRLILLLDRQGDTPEVVKELEAYLELAPEDTAAMSRLEEYRERLTRTQPASLPAPTAPAP